MELVVNLSLSWEERIDTSHREVPPLLRDPLESFRSAKDLLLDVTGPVDPRNNED